MTKDKILTVLFGAALGANVVLAAWIFNASIVTPTVQGQTVDSNGSFLMGTGRLQGKGEADALYIFDTSKRHLCIYFQNRNLELVASRDCTYDFVPQEFSSGKVAQNPTVKAMKEAVK